MFDTAMKYFGKVDGNRAAARDTSRIRVSKVQTLICYRQISFGKAGSFVCTDRYNPYSNGTK